MLGTEASSFGSGSSVTTRFTGAVNDRLATIEGFDSCASTHAALNIETAAMTATQTGEVKDGRIRRMEDSWEII
jgi:hypothetical protein